MKYFVVYESTEVRDPNLVLEDILDAASEVPGLGVVTSGRLNSYPIEEKQLAEMAEENSDYKILFDMSHKREVELIERWHKEGRLEESNWPDYGEMLEWLMEERELAIKSNAEGTGRYWFEQAKKLANDNLILQYKLKENGLV